MANFEVYKSGFKNFKKLENLLQPAADKNKISISAVIVLLAINNGIDLSFIAKEEAIKELVNCGFAQNENGALKVTGKGAILAKSLERMVWFKTNY